MKRKISLKKSAALAVSVTLATGSMASLSSENISAKEMSAVTLPMDLTIEEYQTPELYAQPTATVTTSSSLSTSGASLTPDLQVTFDQPMDTNSSGTVEFGLDGGTLQSVPEKTPNAKSGSTLEYEWETDQLMNIYIPDGMLVEGEAYTVSVAQFTNLSAEEMAYFEETATYEVPTDTTAPDVYITTPGDGDVDVPYYTPIEITFTEDVDLTTVDVTVTSGAGLTTEEDVTDKFDTSSNPSTGDVYTLTPVPVSARDLEAGTFTVTVANVVDSAGNLMEKPYTFTFYTEGAIVPPVDTDTTSPTATLVTPATPTEVPLKTNIVIEFSEDVDLTTGTVTVMNTDTKTDVTSSFQTGPKISAGTTYTMLSTSDLEAGNYEITVNGFVDLAGNSMAEHTFSFTTVGAVPPVVPTVPTVTFVTPENGATKVPVTTTKATIGFSEPMDTNVIGTLTVKDASGKEVSSNGMFLDTTTYTVDLSGLLYNTTYTVEASGFKDLDGNEIPMFKSTFTTATKSSSGGGSGSGSSSNQTGSVGGGSTKPTTTTKPVIKEPEVSKDAETMTLTSEEMAELIESGKDVKFVGTNFTYVMPVSDLEDVIEDNNIDLNKEDSTLTIEVIETELTDQTVEEGTVVSNMYETNVYLNTTKESIEVTEFAKPVTLTVPVVAEETGTVLYGVTVDSKGNERVVPAYTSKGKATLTTMTNDESIYVVENLETFADVEGNWSEEYVNEAASRQFVDGEGTDIYNPNNLVTRAEFTKMVVDAYSIPLVTNGTTSYSDVDSSEWYYDYVVTAEQAGLLTFAEGSSFDPKAPMTREEMAVILENASEYTNEEQTGDVETLNKYVDSSEISTQYEESFAWAVENKIILGLDEAEGVLLSPQGTLTRGQAAAVLIRSMEYNGFIN